MKTLIFTGAGFSRAFTDGGDSLPMPIGSEVLSLKYLNEAKEDHVTDIIDEFPESDRFRILLEVLSDDFNAVEYFEATPDFQRGNTTDIVNPLDPDGFNFEVFYAHCIHQSSNPLFSPNKRAKYINALYQLQLILQRLFDLRIHQRHVNFKLLEEFLKIFVYDNDLYATERLNAAVVFTTNYDNLLEVQHENLDGYEYLLKTIKDVKGWNRGGYENVDNYFTHNQNWLSQPMIVKLHGGINYFSCTNSHCQYYDEPHHHFNTVPLVNHCPMCGCFVIPGILPPTPSKNYATNSYYTRWMDKLAEAIALTERLVIIGYSFPVYDSVITSQITRGLKSNTNLKQIIIVDPINTDRIIAYIRSKIPYGVRSKFRKSGTISELIDNLED